ncbi:MAG TPA: hypothetical protein PLD02_06040 [Saprospiraceae bacterium]|nr:hypothetical protein [Saprospiraceae bacterium]
MNRYELWTGNLRLRKRYYTITDNEGNHLKEVNENGLVWTLDYKRGFPLFYLSVHDALKVIRTKELNICFVKEHFEFKSIVDIIFGYLTFWINFPVARFVISNKAFKDGKYLINLLYEPDKKDNSLKHFENFPYGMTNIEKIFSKNIEAALKSNYVFKCQEDANNFIKVLDPYINFTNCEAELVFVKGKMNTIERIIHVGWFSFSLLLIDLFFNSSFKIFIFKVINLVISLGFNVVNYFYICCMLFIFINILNIILRKDDFIRG